MFRTFVEINADELINMLLSFPMDPSPQFKEIVKDMFLEQQSKGNHNIVDHRKFAEEFIIRRKIDAGILNSSALPNNPLKVPTLSKSETNESFQLVGKKNRKRV
ncbi:hypothetical protein K502DRAFT_129703 [Neoconidiobolus thromboides FSU 785]|nr:hypothetical protein K502DRAFT_129703 [Neoconidiobolus thromboides FSU 785]